MLKRKETPFLAAALLFGIAVFLVGSTRFPGGNLNRNLNINEATVLRFDPETNIRTTRFENRDDISPNDSDFRLLDYSFLSNNQGDRWLLITVENVAAAGRFLKGESIMITFADGQRVFPQGLNEHVPNGESRSKMIYLGQNQFPAVKVTMFTKGN